MPDGRIGRLSLKEDFRRVYSAGSRCATALLVLHARPTDTGCVRLGVSVSKGFGRAVVRNRIRRRLREAVRAERGRLHIGADLVAVPRRPAASASYSDLRVAVREALERLGMGTGRVKGGSSR